MRDLGQRLGGVEMALEEQLPLEQGGMSPRVLAVCRGEGWTVWGRGDDYGGSSRSVHCASMEALKEARLNFSANGLGPKRIMEGRKASTSKESEGHPNKAQIKDPSLVNACSPVTSFDHALTMTD